MYMLSNLKKLSEKIKRKFVEIIDLQNWQIESDEGFVDIKTINKTIKYKVYKIETEKNRVLYCADDHILIDEYGNEIFAKDSINVKIKTIHGIEKVTRITETKKFEHMYDFELDQNSNHLYYANGILSHNTTTYTVFCLWYATLHPEKKIMVCANKLQTAVEVMNRIRLAYEYLPSWIKPGYMVYNKQEITFANRSVIRAFATSSSASRGFTGNVVIIDEMAFIPKNIMDDFFSSVMPIISSSKNSKAIIVSTPNGASGLYYELWTKANTRDPAKNKEGWKPFRIHWWEAGSMRDEAWKQQQIETFGVEKWRQEFECDFLTSSTNRLIPEDTIEKYRRLYSEYKTRKLANGKTLKLKIDSKDELFEFTMWHCFSKTRTYAASADISEGLGGSSDYSVLYVWDITDLGNIKMCAKFSSNSVSVIEFADITKKILALYCNPWFIAERNGVSSGMLNILSVTYGYPRIVMEGKKGEVGIFSHVQVKGRACLWTKDMMSINGFDFTIYDNELIDEFETFIKKDSKSIHPVYSALKNSHDDHMLAFIWLCYLLSNEIVEKYYVVLDTFNYTAEQTYAKLLAPLQEYTEEEIEYVLNSNCYKEFIEYQEDFKAKTNISLETENISKTSRFAVKPESNKKFDMYFNDIDDGPLWSNDNSSIDFSKDKINLNNSVIPQFYV